MADEKQFIGGLIAKKPHDKAPDFVKCNLSIKVEDLGKYLREAYTNGEEWLNVDIKESKGGKWYAEKNTWKPDGNKSDSEPDVPF